VIIHTSEEIDQPYLAQSTNGRLVWLAADDFVLHDVLVALALRYIVSDVAAAETEQFWRPTLLIRLCFPVSDTVGRKRATGYSVVRR
jgi:hypothetical protein